MSRFNSRLDTVIETDRLSLRVPRIEDFDLWAEFMGDAEAARYIGGLQPPAICWRGMAQMTGSWALVGFGMFSVIERASGQWIGRVGPWMPHQWPGPEVGWGIVRSRWGRGYALEAATASMDFAVDVLGWADIVHTIHPENTLSQNLAKKLGSVNRGPGEMPPPYQDQPIDVWGQSAEQWRARRGRRA
jgi:RimJ/RimL family protein N-acetyltransferase